jgi:hypothetical protein
MSSSDLPAWVRDPCPPYPFVLRGQLALPPGAPVPGVRLLGDVHAVGGLGPGRSGARDRARAAALCSSTAHGVLARATAVWVWTGEEPVHPDRLDVAVPDGAPPFPGPRPGPSRHAPKVRFVRVVTDRPWLLLGGVALTSPEVTAADCARTSAEPLARRQLLALQGLAGTDLAVVTDLVRAGPARPGRRRALDLLSTVAAAAGGAQSSATSRCTPLVTR